MALETKNPLTEECRDEHDPALTQKIGKKKHFKFRN